MQVYGLLHLCLLTMKDGGAEGSRPVEGKQSCAAAADFVFLRSRLSLERASGSVWQRMTAFPKQSALGGLALLAELVGKKMNVLNEMSTQLRERSGSENEQEMMVRQEL